MHACLIIVDNGMKKNHIRSSFFRTEKDAIAYAERMAGIVAVEQIGYDKYIWERKAI